MKPHTEADSIMSGRRLEELEAIVEKSKGAFTKAAKALFEIRELKLWRLTPEFKSLNFSEYCAKRFPWAQDYAYKMAKAGEVLNSLPEQFSTIVETETQARELAKVPEPKRVEVLEAAVNKSAARGKPLTAASIKEAAEESEVDANEVTSTEPKQAGWQDSDPAKPVFKPRLDAIIDAVEAATFDLQAFRDGTEQFTPGGAEDVADALRTAAAAIISEGKRMKKMEQ